MSDNFTCQVVMSLVLKVLANDRENEQPIVKRVLMKVTQLRPLCHKQRRDV